MKMKKESENVGLKLNIQNTKIMASSPIISWLIDGGTMEIETSFWGAPRGGYIYVHFVVQQKIT